MEEEDVPFWRKAIGTGALIFTGIYVLTVFSYAIHLKQRIQCYEAINRDREEADEWIQFMFYKNRQHHLRMIRRVRNMEPDSNETSEE